MGGYLPAYGEVPGFPALPDFTGNPGDPALDPRLAALAAQAPAPQFVPLSADPAMRSALGIVDQPALSGRERMLDALAAALLGVQAPQFGAHASGLERFLGGAATGAARAFSARRRETQDERKRVREQNDERMKLLNVADINAVLARRRKSESDAEAEAKKKAAWKVVPQSWAVAAGKPEMAGQRVDDGTYTGLKDTYQAWKDARPKAEKTRTGLSPDQRIRVESNGRRFGQRVRQIESRIEALQKRADDPLYEGDETITGKISTLADTLAQVYDQWDAADAKVVGSPGRARPEAPTGPKVYDHDVRITLPDGRTGTLKAGSPVPAGAKVTGG